MTRRELTDAVRDALGAVEDAAVPDDLREVAFTRALDHLLGAAPMRQSAPDGSRGRQDGLGGGNNLEQPPSPDDPLTKIATKLGVELHEVRDVFDVDEDGVHVLPVPGRFADTKKAATVEVGTLIIAGRQAIGADETGWTSQDIVRGAADAKGVLDEGNFSKAITALESRGIRLRKSSGRGREAKMNDRGFAAAGELVRRLAPQE